MLSSDNAPQCRTVPDSRRTARHSRLRSRLLACLFNSPRPSLPHPPRPPCHRLASARHHTPSHTPPSRPYFFRAVHQARTSQPAVSWNCMFNATSGSVSAEAVTTPPPCLFPPPAPDRAAGRRRDPAAAAPAFEGDATNGSMRRSRLHDRGGERASIRPTWDPFVSRMGISCGNSST